MSRSKVSAAAAVALSLAASSAVAQSITQGAMGRSTSSTVGVAQFPNKTPPPRALPGARADSGSPAPIDRAQSDMKPNDALFDAINRGDVTAARDAIGRGADPDARNILDLTPIDLAVDLGRNDITFLLLALRGGGSADAAATSTARVSGAPAVAARVAERRPVAANRPVAASAATSAPRRLSTAGDGGTPAPQAGFLGFGGGGGLR
jgi:hypothetical protein